MDDIDSQRQQRASEMPHMMEQATQHGEQDSQTPSSSGG
jgi:hypothetical protein